MNLLLSATPWALRKRRSESGVTGTKNVKRLLKFHNSTVPSTTTTTLSRISLIDFPPLRFALRGLRECLLFGEARLVIRWAVGCARLSVSLLSSAILDFLPDKDVSKGGWLSRAFHFVSVSLARGPRHKNPAKGGEKYKNQWKPLFDKEWHKLSIKRNTRRLQASTFFFFLLSRHRMLSAPDFGTASRGKKTEEARKRRHEVFNFNEVIT